MQKTIYKNEEAKKTMMALYEKKLNSLGIRVEERDIVTSAGNTHIIITGNASGKPLILFHGINAGSPLALEAIKDLGNKYKIIAIDSIGQTTKSSETRLPLHDNSLAKWITEVLDALEINTASFVGVSYGGFLLQRLIKYNPARVEKAIFVVPGGFVNGPFFKSMRYLTFPLIKFLISKKDDDLRKFLSSFYGNIDDYGMTMQRTMLLGTKMDYRRPPLMKESDAVNFSGNAYAIVADNDIFFPGRQTIERCKRIFKNFRDYYILKNTKHMPEHNQYTMIQEKIKEWLNE